MAENLDSSEVDKHYVPDWHNTILRNARGIEETQVLEDMIQQLGAEQQLMAELKNLSVDQLEE